MRASALLRQKTKRKFVGMCEAVCEGISIDVYLWQHEEAKRKWEAELLEWAVRMESMQAKKECWHSVVSATKWRWPVSSGSRPDEVDVGINSLSSHVAYACRPADH